MDSVNENWLPHLHPEVVSEVEGNYLDAYVVALEGWRRGLTLRWHVKDSEKFKEMKTWYVDRPGQLFSLHSEEKSHYFFRTRGDKVTNDAVEKGMDKEVTKKILKESGIPVPEGKKFTDKDSEEVIIEFAKTIGFPVVVKPTDGSFGRGVMSDIKTEEELKHSLQYVREQLEEERIIVEKHIPGNDYRLYVVGDEVVGAILRVPPNVVGDGINSIEALIEIKNKERALNPRLAKCPIKINQKLSNYLHKIGYSLESKPNKNEIVYLNNNSNVSIGGDPIDVLNEIPADLIELTLKAVSSVPGFSHGAVDLIIDETDNRKLYVTQLDSTAEISDFLFPFKGNSRDIPASIIDYYFPETKTVQNGKEKIYFDLEEALYPLKENVAVSTKIIDFPDTKLTGKKITIKTVYNLLDNLWIKNKALEYNLHGFIQKGLSEEIEIIIVGSEELIKTFNLDLKGRFEEEQQHYIKVEDWDTPVPIGFKINDLKQDLIKELKYLDQYKAKLAEEQRVLEKDYYEMLNSISWKVTSPIRKITGRLKAYRSNT